ncbi:thiol-disulfide oxidoreductase DCC family protein [Cruoricaptor ignavus]|uniref:thiol-disulfide oxidoreductase DCC family protein n=1 Tax=Cruoricaptor ignavus TaxID=1118202 RepID=UPI00093506C6|nr:DCC1-like thiol-disulfide oxidoreductase family protein [Cruoricaptor ignavus]
MNIIYDDKCGFCTKFSEWCVRSNNKFITLPVRSKEARQILRARGIQFIDLQTIYFVNGGRVFNRSQAVFNIFKNFKFPYYFISFGLLLPISITDYLYKIVAKNRYIISSKIFN